MRLIEMDDNGNTTQVYANSNNQIDDDNFLKPRVLSTLDNVMSEILKTQNTTDVDKWYLYSQALQKYLNYVKMNSKKVDNNSSYPDNNSKIIQQPEDRLNNSFLQFDISGVEPFRDSLDSISQPVVRNFFEKARQANISLDSSTSSLPIVELVTENKSAPQKRRTKPKNTVRVLPYRTRKAKTTKRRAETSLSADISQVKPCKVRLERINWEPTSAR